MGRETPSLICQLHGNFHFYAVQLERSHPPDADIVRCAAAHRDCRRFRRRSTPASTRLRVRKSDDSSKAPNRRRGAGPKLWNPGEELGQSYWPLWGVEAWGGCEEGSKAPRYAFNILRPSQIKPSTTGQKRSDDVIINEYFALNLHI